jgi:DNA (cytosine-5)-methyltransferase 1
MFVHFFRLVGELNPAFFVAENVPGILTPSYDGVLDQALSQLPRHYSVLPPMILNASDYGVATQRRRVFFIGYHTERLPACAGDALPYPVADRITVEAALAGLPRKIDPLWQSSQRNWRKVKPLAAGPFRDRISSLIPPGIGDATTVRRLKEKQEVSGFLGTQHTPAVLARLASLAPGDIDRVSRCFRLDPKGFCPTLRAGTGREKGSFQSVRPIHPTEDRVITAREAARLQGFPDWFLFPATKWHSFRLIGNSVSPIIAQALLEKVHEFICSQTPLQ